MWNWAVFRQWYSFCNIILIFKAQNGTFELHFEPWYWVLLFVLFTTCNLKCNWEYTEAIFQNRPLSILTASRECKIEIEFKLYHISRYHGEQRIHILSERMDKLSIWNYLNTHISNVTEIINVRTHCFFYGRIKYTPTMNSWLFYVLEGLISAYSVFSSSMVKLLFRFPKKIWM